MNEHASLSSSCIHDRADPRANRGWMAIGREKASQSLDRDEVAALREKTPDYKETMEIGCEWDRTWRNHWPQEQDLPGFKPAVLGFFQVRRTVLEAEHKF